MNDKIFKELEGILGKNGISDDAAYAKDWTSYFKPKFSGAVFPKTTEEVLEIVRLANLEKIAIVPSGGRTGLSGGAVATQSELVLSLDRMNKILDFNEFDRTITVEAGVVTKTVQGEAAQRGFYYPIEFGSSGSSQIGGNIATNAGGLRVIKYGGTREWVKGLEVITGRGEKLQLNKGLVKNNTGYDLRHLMIGSEGSLGIVTQATLGLTKLPEAREVFLFGLESLDKCLELLKLSRQALDLSAFEIFGGNCLDYVLKISELPEPLSQRYAYYALIEHERSEESSQDRIDGFIDEAFDKGFAVDATQSQNEKQFHDIWSYRETITESISPYRPYKNDVSCLSSKAPAFMAALEKLLKKRYSDFELLLFGHLGDGNIHVNILKPESLEPEDFFKKCQEVDAELFQMIESFSGSISAEHGIGLIKKPFLQYSRSESEIQLMRELKRVFDPNLILNPGKIFDL